MHLVPIAVTKDDTKDCYEGFFPLAHVFPLLWLPEMMMMRSMHYEGFSHHLGVFPPLVLLLHKTLYDHYCDLSLSKDSMLFKPRFDTH